MFHFSVLSREEATASFKRKNYVCPKPAKALSSTSYVLLDIYHVRRFGTIADPYAGTGALSAATKAAAVERCNNKVHSDFSLSTIYPKHDLRSPMSRSTHTTKTALYAMRNARDNNDITSAVPCLALD